MGVRGVKVVGNVVMRRGTRVLVACAVGLMLAWAPMAGVRAQSPSLGDSGEASTFVPAERLADPAGRADELAVQRRELEAVSAQAAAGLERAQAQLALANWILAVPTACAATRSLLGLELPSDAKTLADAGQEAQRLIEQVREAMEVAKSESDAVSAGPDGEEAATARRRLETALENLEPLAALFATAAEADEDGGRAMWSRAARGLAVLREAADAELASCAMLWQAYAWLEAGRQDRARALLPRPLRQPDTTAYGFMSRLLGCRMLGDEGQYTAASALAMRVPGGSSMSRPCRSVPGKGWRPCCRSAWASNGCGNCASPTSRLASLSSRRSSGTCGGPCLPSRRCRSIGCRTPCR